MAIIRSATLSGGGADTADTTPPSLTIRPIGTLTLMTLDGQKLFDGLVANNPAVEIAGNRLTLHCLIRSTTTPSTSSPWAAPA